MTRNIFSVINQREHCDQFVNIFTFPDCIEELRFWQENILSLKPSELFNIYSDFHVFTDASDTGAGGFVSDSAYIFHKMWLNHEKVRSSTWREIKAIQICLKSCNKVLRNSTITVHTDNQNARIFSSGFWNNSDLVQSSELKMLLSHLRSTVIDSRAKTTVSKYADGFKRFLAWAQKYPEIDSILPASELYVSLYLQHLMQTLNHFSLVETAFYSIKWAHKLANLVDPCDSDLVRSIVESSKRILNRPVQKKEPIDATTIKTLFNRFCNPRTLRDLRLLSICTVSYAGFLRYSELCSIKANNLSFKPEYLEIFISSSKTDCYSKGKSVVIKKKNTLLSRSNFVRLHKSR
ncbi:unnamed protein product [Mytilus coruscus]|uniref:Reverse transcriptase RNase H-like domain-containing protein n=1 Tax=Mytilus coruscus TaxID=42192 RepID=A0A6J8BJ01_MYTCO|nr:unnamed protein product [Mytilus coruscus]